MTVVRLLGADEARAITDEVKGDARALWGKMAGLYEGQAHRALGYTSWHAYCAAEFDMGMSHAYRLLDANLIAEMLDSPVGESPANESVARALTPLRKDPDVVREAWAQAIKEHGPQPTAAQVGDIVREIVKGEPADVEAIVRPPDPGDDLRTYAAEDAADMLKRSMPRPEKTTWPTQPGDIDAMDAAIDYICAWGPRARAAWRTHKARLKAVDRQERDAKRGLRAA